MFPLIRVKIRAAITIIVTLEKKIYLMTLPPVFIS